MSHTVNSSIAKNTAYLVTRIILITIVSFFTSRVYLKELGVVDFGLYNLVGGIISVLGILQGVLASAVSRFFIIEIGKENIDKLNQYFSISIIVYLIFIVVLLIASQTIGKWFLYNKLTIPPDRQLAAYFVYQASVFSFLISMLTVPFNSLILAYERLKIYALFGIIESAMKLLIAYFLTKHNSDKLILFSLLNFVTILILFFSSYFFCKINFNHIKFKFLWHWGLLKEMFNYSIWTLVGAVSSIARNQGLNILLGVFFSPATNAARAIANQLNDAATMFSNNFQIASRPRITKLYISGDKTALYKLILSTSKTSFFLLYLISLPLIAETNFVLNIWLVDPPIQSIIFTKIIIATSLVDSLSYPLISTINAIGKIKIYQIVTGGLLILTLPISYLFLILGYGSEIVLYVALLMSCLAQISRIFFVNYFIQISIKEYFLEVIVRVIIVVVLTLVIPLYFISFMPIGWERFIVILIVNVVSCLFFIYFFGLNHNEKKILINFFKEKTRHF